MLHTKSQGHRPSGSGEEDFWRVFTIYGRGGHLGHVTRTIWTNFHSPILRSLHMKYEFNWPSSYRGDVWKCWRTTDGRTMDAGVTGILLAHQWAFGSGELIMNKQQQNHRLRIATEATGGGGAPKLCPRFRGCLNTKNRTQIKEVTHKNKRIQQKQSSQPAIKMITIL